MKPGRGRARQRRDSDDLAEAIEQLIALGHSPAAVWDYSRRQTAAFVEIAHRRRKREMREQLAIQALAARGDPKTIQKALKDDP